MGIGQSSVSVEPFCRTVTLVEIDVPDSVENHELLDPSGRYCVTKLKAGTFPLAVHMVTVHTPPSNVLVVDPKTSTDPAPKIGVRALRMVSESEEKGIGTVDVPFDASTNVPPTATEGTTVRLPDTRAVCPGCDTAEPKRYGVMRGHKPYAGH